MHAPLRLKSIIDAFSSAFSPAFGSGGTSPVGKNTAHGGLTWRLSINAAARTREPRDIAGTLHNELSSSLVTTSQLINMLTGSPRRVAGNLSNQLASAQTTLAQLLSILPK